MDLSVNSARQPEIARAEERADGTLLIAVDAWTSARLAPLAQQRALSDGTPAYALGDVPGATYRLDRRSQTLEIQVPASAFVGSTVAQERQAPKPPPRPAPGFMLNYDAVATRAAGAGRLTTGAVLEAVGFGPFGHVVTSGLYTDDGVDRQFARLDTYWRHDLPHRMQTLVVGDTVGVSGGWSRPVRFGGVRWGRDFSQRPGFVTMPQPTLSGEAALPSTVEVLVNNTRRISQSVQPGPFDLPQVPVITGAGELNLVVRDLLGRETVLRQSYYASPRLLAPGLSDFSFEAGWMRTGFGRDSAYGDAFSAATLRRGLSDRLTGEGRVELQRGRQAAGIELAGLLGTWGVARLAAASSRSSLHGLDEQGHHVQAGVERSTPTGGGALHYEYSTQGFAPIGEASHPLARARRSRERLVATLGGRIFGPLSGGINYLRQVRWDGESLSSVGLGVNVPVFGRGSLSIGLSRRLGDDRAWAGAVSLNLPLDHGRYASARVDRQNDGRLAAAVGAGRNPPPGPGWGWRAEVTTVPQQRARGGVQYNTEHFETTGDFASDAQGRVSARAGARGTVGRVAGVPFATRPVGQGSVAVVQVEGIAGVPVMRSNQVVATTNERGVAFVPGLVPWHPNAIQIDPVDIPLDAEVKEVAKEVVPYARSGALVRFDIRRTRQALLVLHRPGGEPVPLGAVVRLLPDGPEFVAGRRGEVWLTDLAAERQRLQVRWENGGCELDLQLPPAPQQAGPATIGPLTCR